MSDETRCEPPPEWRERNWWHWVEYPNGFREVWHWWRAREVWQWQHRSRELQEMCRYLAPVTPPATVAALVEALEAADQFIRNGIEFGFIRMPNPDTPDPALETPGKVAQALAAYREAGR